MSKKTRKTQSSKAQTSNAFRDSVEKMTAVQIIALSSDDKQRIAAMRDSNDKDDVRIYRAICRRTAALRYALIAEFIEAAKYTRVEIVDKVLAEHSFIKRNSVETVVTDSQNVTMNYYERNRALKARAVADPKTHVLSYSTDAGDANKNYDVNFAS